jgi:HSP20 family protein
MIYRRITNPYTFRDMMRLQNEMNHMFNFAGFEQMQSSCFPLVNVWSNDEKMVVTAELPGINVDQIDLSVVGDTLTLSGDRPEEKVEDSAEYHRQERAGGKFSRSIELTYPVETDKVSASFEKGILTVTLPRAEEDKPRKITVKAS